MAGSTVRIVVAVRVAWMPARPEQTAMIHTTRLRGCWTTTFQTNSAKKTAGRTPIAPKSESQAPPRPATSTAELASTAAVALTTTTALETRTIAASLTDRTSSGTGMP